MGNSQAKSGLPPMQSRKGCADARKLCILERYSGSSSKSGIKWLYVTGTYRFHCEAHIGLKAPVPLQTPVRFF